MAKSKKVTQVYHSNSNNSQLINNDTTGNDNSSDKKNDKQLTDKNTESGKSDDKNFDIIPGKV